MTRRRLARLLVAGAAAGAAACLGDASPARAALTYDVSLGAGGIFTDNLHLSPDPPPEGGRPPVEEAILAVRPGAAVSWEAPDDRFEATYRGQYWTFSGDEDRDPLWLHDLRAELGWRRWSPFFVEAEGVRERTPRYQDSEGQAVLDQLDRTWLSLRPGLGRDWGARGRVELAYRGEREAFSGADDADDVWRNFGEGLLRYRWTPLTETEATLSYGKVDRDQGYDYAELRGVVSVERRLSEHLSVEARLEAVHEDPDEGTLPAGAATGDARTNLLKTLTVGGDLERGGSWRLSYEDRREDTPDGDILQSGRAAGDLSYRARLGGEVDARLFHEVRDFEESGREERSWGPVLVARWRVARWAALDLGAGWTHTAGREPGEEEVTDRTLRAAAAFIVRAGGHLEVEVGYGHRENDSSDESRSYASNIGYAWLTWRFGVAPPGTLPGSDVSALVSSARGTAVGR